jgi:hypothetical protein
VDVTITLQGQRSAVVPGPLELTLPVAVKGGPAMLVTLRAVVVVPEVAVSATHLDFGTVHCGHCKVG